MNILDKNELKRYLKEAVLLFLGKIHLIWIEISYSSHPNNFYKYSSRNSAFLKKADI